MVIVAGRGCPMQCSYCCFGQHSIVDCRQRSVQSVIQEIEHAAKIQNVGFIDFEDDNLSLDRRWFLDLLKSIQCRFGSGRFELRAMKGLYPPSLDEELIRAMKSAGFRTINLSLGSTSKAQLRRFNRPDVTNAFNRVLKLVEDCRLDAVGYVISAAPFQQASESIADLLFLAQRRVLAGVSIFYPAPGSRDYEWCQKQNLLPGSYACLRSSALPLSHTTSRKEAATILRLGRVLNFMKFLIDRHVPLPSPSSDDVQRFDPADRIETGKRLLSKFLADGKICGITPEGEIFDHCTSERLCRQFLTGLKSINIRGTQ